MPEHASVLRQLHLAIAYLVKDGVSRSEHKIRVERVVGVVLHAVVLPTNSKVQSQPRLDLPGVHLLRTLDDSTAIRRDIEGGAKRALIVGGGYIGLEVAAVVRGEGRDVVVLEALDRVLERVTGPPISDFYTSYHLERGVEVRLGAKEEMSQRHLLLTKAMGGLNPRERAIITARRLSEEPETLEDLSQRFGVSRERVRQIEVRAFEKLQKNIKRTAEDEGLVPPA